MKTVSTLLFLLWTGSAVCSAGQALTIALYDYSGIPERELAEAAGTADVVMGHSGIDIHWLHCRGAAFHAFDPRCGRPGAAKKVLVRLIPPPPGLGNQMGDSLVGARGGAFSTVYVGSVRAKAAEWEIPAAQLLGYVIAHETVHCLLGPGHSSAGLMSGAWGRQHAREIARLSLGLSGVETRRLLCALSEHGADTPSNTVRESRRQAR